jgi:hypothetical protein
MAPVLARKILQNTVTQHGVRQQALRLYILVPEGLRPGRLRESALP